MRKTLMALLLEMSAAVTAEPTSTHAQTRQQMLTPFQQQGLRAIKKVLTETIEKYHRNLDALNDPAVAAAVSQMDRLDVLDEVLRDWTDTPEYGRYAVNVMVWQNHLVMTIADMADDYTRQHGALDAGFETELRHRIVSDPAYTPQRNICTATSAEFRTA
jgi:hypothetical protein